MHPSLQLIALALTCAQVPASTHLEEATACMGVADFPCAEAALRDARAALASAPDPVRHDVLELSAELAVKLDHREEAREHLAALRALDPDFDPGKRWAPAWRELLEEVRATMPDRAAPTVEITPPLPVAAGDPVEVRALIEDRSAVTSAVLVAGELRMPMTHIGGPEWVGRVLGEHVRAPFVVIAVEATDRWGNGPTRTEVTIPVAAAPPPADVAADAPEFYETWWFWTAVGAVVAGITVGAALGAADGPARPQRSVIWRFE